MSEQPRIFSFFDTTVEFDSTSTIKFYKDDKLILQLDPTELSVLYGAYLQMKNEQTKNK